MCFSKKAISPSTITNFPHESNLKDFSETCITSQITWPIVDIMPSPSSIDFEQSLQRKNGVSQNLTLKRLKNKEAAARSREKKMNKILELESKVKILEDEKSVLTLQLAILDSEKKASESREEEYKNRIFKLEEYLYKARNDI